MSSTLPPDTQSDTVELLVRLRAGDDAARARLVERALPPLLQWARGRLPGWARTMSDTQDLVQDAVLNTLPRLGSFQAEGPGALQAFLKRAVKNHVVDEIRKAQRRRTVYDIPESHPEPGPGPLEQAVQQQGVARYRAALATLSPADQTLIVARIERQEGYAEIAVAHGKPTANAARVSVTRALARLVKTMARQVECSASS
jgi:RNA polymerase sigma factor (sigma-70 family)